MERPKYLSKEKINNLPKSPGLYLFKKGDDFLYIGKATEIKKRVKNHFLRPTYRDNLFINQVKKIGYIETNSNIEALILEANLIKKYQPKYNIIWRDDKNYFYVGMTKEDFPQIFLTHQTKKNQKQNSKSQIEYAGPFVEGKALKQTLKVLRKIFPYRSCQSLPRRACLWYHLNRCPAPCLLKSKLFQKISFDSLRIKKICQKNAKNIIIVLKKGKDVILKKLKKEMEKAAANQEFEEAARIRDQILALKKVLTHAKIFEYPIGQIKPYSKNYNLAEKGLKNLLKTEKKISRIEAYDASNIQGKKATASMVTFINGLPEKKLYRKFKIKSSEKPNDIAMLKECLERRFKHQEWGLPDLILIDGGKTQLKAACQTLKIHFKKEKSIPIMALAKHRNLARHHFQLHFDGERNELYIENQKKPIPLKNLSRPISNLILQLRDEAHRFAKKYHLKLREIDFKKKL